MLTPLGQNTYTLAESNASFSPGNLQLHSVNRAVNDLTVLGGLEPGAHVKDYFVGDGRDVDFLSFADSVHSEERGAAL